jgi:hypothetical protein
MTAGSAATVRNWKEGVPRRDVTIGQRSAAVSLVNSWLVEEQRRRHLDAPDSADPAWRDLFAGLARTSERPADDTRPRPDGDVNGAATKAVRVAA